MDEATIPSDCQHAIAEFLSADLLQSGPRPTIVDFCCGGAWLPIRLINALERIEHVFLCDNAQHQIEAARANIQRFVANETPVRFILGSVLEEFAETKSASVVLNSFAIHLFQGAKRASLARACANIAAQDALLAILTFDRQDVRETLFHRNIPGYWEVDERRYVEFDRLKQDFEDADWEYVQTKKFPFARNYGSVEEFMSFARSKPFSTFDLLEREAGPEGFANHLQSCEQKLRASFGDGPVANRGRVSLLVFRMRR